MSSRKLKQKAVMLKESCDIILQLHDSDDDV